MPKGRRTSGRGGGGGAAVVKKKDRLVREALRRERKSGAYLDPADPDFRSFRDQLQAQGLKLHEVPADGNCLFHTLSDQLPDDHRNIRHSVVSYMREHREDFAPFVEDGISFEDSLTTLSKDGEYAGNEAIVAFARCYGVSVVIHQLNAPRWEVLGSKGPEGRTLHIAYLNGEHYCPVRPILAHQTLPSATHVSSGHGQTPPVGGSWGEEPLLRMLSDTTGCQDPALIRQCLLENDCDPDMAIVELMQLMQLTEDSPPPPPTTKQADTEPEVARRKLPPEGGQQLKRGTRHKLEAPQRHLSNRERKEQAKAARKKRRVEEQRQEGARQGQRPKTDPVGAVAI